jgi:Holliday junction DNA helicase RuvA
MISHLRGTIIDKDIRHCIVEVGGVGYKVSVTEDTLRTLKQGESIALFTHLAVREDAQDLYGFLDKESRGLFELLIGISGIGPKTALGVINVASTQTLRRAVSAGDLAYLTKVSGIGRKLAEKIILELREKITVFGTDTEASGDLAGEADVLEALKSLGYSERDSREALKALAGEQLSTGNKVKKALKLLGSK